MSRCSYRGDQSGGPGPHCRSEACVRDAFRASGGFSEAGRGADSYCASLRTQCALVVSQRLWLRARVRWHFDEASSITDEQIEDAERCRLDFVFPYALEDQGDR